MVIDGRDVGKGMALNLIGQAFSALAADFADVDHEGALASLVRIELSIADALTDFRLKSPEGTDVYDAAFEAMLQSISMLVEDARDAVKARGGTAE